MLASEDKKKAVTSLRSVFKHPVDVVACGDLSKAEKTVCSRSPPRKAWVRASTACSPASKRPRASSMSTFSNRAAPTKVRP